MSVKRSRKTPGPSRWARARARYRWLDHLARATNRYLDYGGYHYVASITYFSLLSLVPILMVSSSAAGFVLATQPHLLDALVRAISGSLPGPIGTQVSSILTGFVEQRTGVGVAGLVVGLYSGWNWMNALRDALTAMYGQNRSEGPLLRTILTDVLALLGLGAALLVSFGITVSGTAVGRSLLALVGVADTGWGRTVLSVASVPLALLADWLVFLWVLTRLPRERVGWRSAMRGAVAAALGFELLKQAGGFYLTLISRSPSGVAFGSVIGLLFFISLIARMLIYITAWTATARDAPRKPIQPPPAAQLRPIIAPKQHNATAAVLGAVVGALGTLFALRRRRKDS
ncbi:YhjD/YihY/BrkB family envelope integrity protein [Amycolatopsis benzoatilytica]|uniref:YhjD/YihY/BrkB family envelope integrity protein n=1 Tax=Amycolatopsis benzoatilytica TaxID=346045 RepID=UPI00035EF3E1|nr:YhjD/YihY/BrkB family envelope integrity protein [Amycolatopsis benzoatilytica]